MCGSAEGGGWGAISGSLKSVVGRVRQPPISPIIPILVGWVGVGAYRTLAPIPRLREVFGGPRERGGADASAFGTLAFESGLGSALLVDTFSRPP